MDAISELLDLVTGKLTQVAQSDIVVGDPVELGGVTFVPLSRISVGIGGGGGEGEGEGQGGGPRGRKKGEASFHGRGRGAAGGSGGGAKVRPVAVVVFTDEGVEVQPIDERKGVIEKVFDKVPELIEMAQKASGKE